MSLIADRLLQHAQQIEEKPVTVIRFTNDDEVNQLLSDLENHPHLFVLACVMDQQIKAERAWTIPITISKVIGSVEFAAFANLTEDHLQAIFHKEGLHRFNDKMASWFFLAIKDIQELYSNDASNIWCDEPSSATIVRRFLSFQGVGPKIATMATNILARDFRIPMRDKISVDISADVHTKRVFHRLGITNVKDDANDVIYAAREMNPLYPGIFDLVTWEIGRQWCTSKNPACSLCYMNDLCDKTGVNKFS